MWRCYDQQPVRQRGWAAEVNIVIHTREIPGDSACPTELMESHITHVPTFAHMAHVCSPCVTWSHECSGHSLPAVWTSRSVKNGAQKWCWCVYVMQSCRFVLWLSLTVSVLICLLVRCDVIFWCVYNYCCLPKICESLSSPLIELCHVPNLCFAKCGRNNLSQFGQETSHLECWYRHRLENVTEHGTNCW